jgi:hypothetical protein
MHSHEVGTLSADFKTLGDLWSSWMERHCRVPDRHERGKPFREYDWQFWCTAHEGQIRPDAKFDPADPPLNQAFVFRRTQIIAPQKTGKGPRTAARVCLSAVGPSEFSGWAKAGDKYRCEDHGCPCGWEYAYIAGEPMGMRNPSPLIQIMATSDDQVANIWRPLTSMIALGPLKALILPRGEFMRIVGEAGDKDMDRIDRVTASALSRLGAPVSDVFGDETGLFTSSNKLIGVWETMRRGAAGMGGRAHETTNMYDPSEQSSAQRTHESKSKDIFRFYRDPSTLKRPDGKPLSFKNARERKRILKYVYSGSLHIKIPSIDAEALEIMELDPAQAERFFGNMKTEGAGAWCSVEEWRSRRAPRDVLIGEQVVVAFDGSDVDDWTGFRCETRDGYQFTPVFADGTEMIWNPADYPDHQVPRLEVNAAMDYIMETFNVARVYADPPYWDSEIDAWAEKHGADVVFRWYTRREIQMHAAAERLLTDLRKKDSTFTHDGCATTEQHIIAARKSRRGTIKVGDDVTLMRYKLTKPGDGRKIDMAIPSILAHQAHGDATALGWPEKQTDAYAYYA